MAAYTSVGSGFNVTSAQPVDRRLILSRAEMRNLKFDDDGKKFSVPVRSGDAKTNAHYLALCSEDGCLYIYTRAVPKDPDTENGTGYFHPLEAIFDYVGVGEEHFLDALKQELEIYAEVDGGVVGETAVDPAPDPEPTPDPTP